MSPPAGAGCTHVMNDAIGSGEMGGKVAAASVRSLATRIFLAALALAGVAVFVALGVWQLERRVWKLDLIARVESRVHAPAVDAPGPDEWPAVNAAGYEYRHVRLTGRFLDKPATLVRAVTDLGGGYWVLSPLLTDRGFVVLVNRGFIPPEKKAAFSRAGEAPATETTLTGLLRITEPKGGFLRSNDPASERWYSRDVAAIAVRRGLGDVAPYFVDADAAAANADDGWPRGGLTVIHFRNAHMVYALTWFSLAAMLLLALARPFLGKGRADKRDA